MDRIALTFDDGPAPWTEPILELLEEHAARATFFVIGSIARDGADLLRKMVAGGHEVGNHTWSHPRLARECDATQVHDELARTNDVLVEILGSRPSAFARPITTSTTEVEAIADRLGLTHTRGDVTPPDYDESSTAGFIATFILQQVRPGAVVGLHDGVPPHKIGSGASRQATVDAVRMIAGRGSRRTTRSGPRTPWPSAGSMFCSTAARGPSSAIRSSPK